MEGTVGTIMLFAGDFAPQNWMFCDGQEMDINNNAALYSIIGVNYGGDGRTKFNLPKLTHENSNLHYIICIAGLYPSRP